jgi:hypothetical protein
MMRNIKKTILVVLTATLLLGATPAFAQLAGTWVGTGTGNAYPRSGVVIYPWQDWKGEIPNSEDVFTGEWYDSLGNYGIFKGKAEWIDDETAIAKGAWYWYDPLGPSNQPKYGGDFEMTFYVGDEICDGIWTTIWPSTGAQGTMEGWKVE